MAMIAFKLAKQWHQQQKRKNLEGFNTAEPNVEQ